MVTHSTDIDMHCEFVHFAGNMTCVKLASKKIDLLIFHFVSVPSKFFLKEEVQCLKKEALEGRCMNRKGRAFEGRCNNRA
jgi:hypothetical protein